MWHQILMVNLQSVRPRHHSLIPDLILMRLFGKKVTSYPNPFWYKQGALSWICTGVAPQSFVFPILIQIFQLRLTTRQQLIFQQCHRKCVVYQKEKSIFCSPSPYSKKGERLSECHYRIHFVCNWSVHIKKLNNFTRNMLEK